MAGLPRLWGRRHLMPRPNASGHPSRTAYTHGCRCDGCRAANAAYHSAWRHRTRRTDPGRRNATGGGGTGRGWSHGLSGYVSYGCRCDVCRVAHTDYRRARREGN